MSRVDELRLELAVAELEAHYIEIKEQIPRCETCGRRDATAAGDPGLRDIKHELRAARKAHREAREG